jgi:hypothetical protein
LFPISENVNLQGNTELYVEGNFEAILKSESAQQILKQNPDGIQDLEICITKNVAHYLDAISDCERHCR